MNTADQELVDEQIYSWTEMHKKSAVSFLILSALKTKNMWSKELVKWVQSTAGWELTEHSLYRILRRMQKQGTIQQLHVESVAGTGAERKIYALTTEGKAILAGMKQELSYLEKL